MQGTTSATPVFGVEGGAQGLPTLIADLDITPAEDLVPGRPRALRPCPGGAFGGVRSCSHWRQVPRGRDRYEVVEYSEGAAVVDLVTERLAAPRVAWSRADADLVADVLVEVPGYEVLIPWRSSR